MFKLLIECTKDISEISINFTDGTSVVKSSDPEKPEPKKPETPKPKKPKPNVPKPKETNFSEARRELLDLDDSNTSVSNIKPSQVLKPEIANHDRQVKVATELQNLDI